MRHKKGVHPATECVNCGESYCENDGKPQRCDVCNHELWSVKVTSEEIEGLHVDWVMVSNHRRVGLVARARARFGRPPMSA